MKYFFFFFVKTTSSVLDEINLKDVFYIIQFSQDSVFNKYSGLLSVAVAVIKHFN